MGISVVYFFFAPPAAASAFLRSSAVVEGQIGIVVCRGREVADQQAACRA